MGSSEKNGGEVMSDGKTTKNGQQPREALFSYPEPDRKLLLGWKGLLGFLGPGVILASATVGSGEVFFAPRGAAIFGYGILWCLVLGALSKGFMSYTGTRYIVLTGEHPITRWGHIFPGPKNWFPVLLGILAVLSMPSWVGGVANLLANMTMYLTGGSLSIPLWATIYILGTLVVVASGTYQHVETTQTYIVITKVLTSFIALFAVNPDWGQLLAGLIPSFPSYEAWVSAKYPAVAARSIGMEMVAYVGAIGGGTYDYIGYVGLYRNKGWGAMGLPNHKEIEEKLRVTEGQFNLPSGKAEVAKANTWLRAAQIDTIVSFGTLLLITVVFTALGAAVLHTEQLIPSGMKLLEYQSAFLTVVHPGLVYLYWLAVWCALWGVLSSIFELYPSTCYEAFRTASGWVRAKGKSGIAKYVWVYMCLGGLAYNWAGFNVVTIVMVGSILGGALSCGLWCLAQIYAERKVLPPEYRMAPWVVCCVAVSGVFLIAMAVFSVLDQFKLI